MRTCMGEVAREKWPMWRSVADLLMLELLLEGRSSPDDPNGVVTGQSWNSRWKFFLAATSFDGGSEL